MMNLPVSVSHQELLDVLLNISPARPVYIWGAPGIGKSALVEKFADEVGMPCVSLLGSQLAPEDIIGIPQIQDGVSAFLPPRMIARKDPYILFLDELNACSQEVQKAFYSLIYERRVGEYHLPEGSIVIGAGNDFLLLLLVTMLGTGLTYAMESPTYLKACELLRSFSGRIAEIPHDSAGMLADALKESGADIAYVMPSHQFPLGTVMPVGRRMRLLEWAAEKADRYIIEDDYDSEFRYRGKPIPALQGMDICDKVIYLGTFSKSIAPAIRISYLVLPEQLTELYRQRGRRISSTVSRMDQMVLCEFIRGGYFERHLNRMRSVYKNRHDLLLEELRDFREILRISGENAGSHILLTFQNGMTEEEAVRRAAEAGVGVYGLSRYLISRKEDTGTVLLGYATVQENQIHDAVQLLRGAWGLKFHENETN